MANDCSRLMKEALDNYLGIDMRYKLDDTLASLGKQKFSAKQLEGYLLKQGVSPKEIKQSGIFEGMEADNRAISAEDWLGMSGKQKVNTYNYTQSGDEVGYASVTLDGKGAETDTYRTALSGVIKPKANAPYEPHFAHMLPSLPNNKEVQAKEAVDRYLAKEQANGRTLIDIFKDAEYKKLYSELQNTSLTPDNPQSLLGWRRTHVQEIEGKPTLVLNEFQSDWAQTERAGRGKFESNAPSSTSPSMSREKAEGVYARHVESFFKDMQEAEPDKTLSMGEIQDKYWDDWVDYRTDSGPAELIEANKIIADGRTSVVADFPMNEVKHHQFQIVGAIDDALKQGIDTIVIPIKRENELAGTEGVTKFYESLNQKVLPDIRKKLEKQGMRIKVDKTPYGEASVSRNSADKIIKENYNNLSAEAKADLSLDELMAMHSYNDRIQTLTHMADSYGGAAFNEEFKKLANDPASELVFSSRYLNGLLITSDKNAPAVLDDLLAQPWFKAFEHSEFYPYRIPADELLKNGESPARMLENIGIGLLNAGKGKESNELWRLTVEEIPNKKVNWDVYGLIGALGLTSMLSGNAEAKETQNIVSPKPQQEHVTKVPATRQEAEQGTLQRILSQNKVAPLNEPKGVLQQYRDMGLISQKEEDSYGFEKDDTILDDYRVDMKRHMPKTIQEQEGNNLSAHRPTRKSGWTIGRGYDLTGRKLNDVIADFKEAGISEGQARAFFNHKHIKINAKQSKALGDIAWREKVATARSIGLPVDKLNREGFLKVMSLVYRGDIVKGDSGYRGKLYDLAKKGDIKAIDRFVLNDSVKILKSNVLYNRWKKFDKS